MVIVEEEELQRRELANSVFAGICLGAVAAMLAAVFADGGRLYLMLIGG